MNNIIINTLVWKIWFIFVRIYFLLNKGLNNVYTIKLIKQKNDRQQGIVSNNKGIIISILFSLLFIYW